MECHSSTATGENTAIYKPNRHESKMLSTFLNAMCNTKIKYYNEGNMDLIMGTVCNSNKSTRLAGRSTEI
jgi:hypothetical protein